MSNLMSFENDRTAFTFDKGVLTISGKLTASTVGSIEQELSAYSHEDIKIIDGTDIGALDTSGAVFITRISSETAELRGFSSSAAKLINMARPIERIKKERAPKRPPINIERFGGLALKIIDRINEIAVLTVDVLYWSVVALFDRSQYRKGTFTEQAFYMGSTALPIVGIILFLIGGISVLQSTATLKSFGASIFVVDMLAIGLSREMAPLMTAIIISGRSGSAIASEIATMKFTEELDAIKTMGLNPLRFIVVPKLWAMTVCMPLLSIVALGFGLLGGFFVAIIYIDLSPNTFLSRLVVSLFFWDIITGLIKSVSFAIIITIVGTYRGLTFSGGADGVGRATTQSVVSSIFAMIIMDSIWGIIFYL
ncbi:MlaE family ABC transporter permease [Candidatus Latescibacterota bacterium]